MLPFLAEEQYGPALSLGVDLIAQAFAAEFGVTLSNPQFVRPPPQTQPVNGIPIGFVIVVIVLLIILSRGRVLLIPWMLMQGGRGSGWGGGGWGGGRGGGGFGGFGGGGGFSAVVREEGSTWHACPEQSRS